MCRKEMLQIPAFSAIFAPGDGMGMLIITTTLFLCLRMDGPNGLDIGLYGVCRYGLCNE